MIFIINMNMSLSFEIFINLPQLSQGIDNFMYAYLKIHT